MADKEKFKAKDHKQSWNPYETSYKRQYVYQPNSAAEILLPPESASFKDSYSQSEPLGVTEYTAEFYWKTVCKPKCINITDSGQRKNNPHPSQTFMLWTLPRDARQNSKHVAVPFETPPSEEKILEAIKAQHCSIYKRDFTVVHRGCDGINMAGGHLVPIQTGLEARVPISTNAAKASTFNKPNQKAELLANLFYSCNRNPHGGC